MVNMRNKYLSKCLLKDNAEIAQSKHALDFLNRFRKNPIYGYALFAGILIMLQIMSNSKIVSSSFMTAIGSTIIFCIVGLGFCLLLGYSALASLGTAGFIGSGISCPYRLQAEPKTYCLRAS